MESSISHFLAIMSTEASHFEPIVFLALGTNGTFQQEKASTAAPMQTKNERSKALSAL